jgi:hypothetical protein
MPNGSVRRLFVVEPWATVLGSESASSSDLSFCVDELEEDDDEVWGVDLVFVLVFVRRRCWTCEVPPLWEETVPCRVPQGAHPDCARG